MLHKIAVTVDVAHESGEEAIAARALKTLFAENNLDISEVGDSAGSVIVHEVTEPEASGRRYFAQLTYVLVVEATSAEAAQEAVDESICFYADGWAVDQIAVRNLS
jgi:hypothetical protein